jgi:hypothetical protein
MSLPRQLRSQFLGPSGWARVQNSAVVWSWAYNGLRLASGFILLPLVLRKLSTPDYGMYVVFTSLISLVPLVDFGFGPTVGRFVSYAIGGARAIQAQGIAPPPDSTEPNYSLLWELLATTRTLYRFLSLGLLLILGCWGTFMVHLRIHETSSVLITELAWGLTMVSALFDVYSSWWATFLRSMNKVVDAARITVYSTLLRLIIASVLLLLGAGLLSLPIGTLLGSALQRWWSRQRCLAFLSPHAVHRPANVTQYLRILWPNSWRLGVQVLSSSLVVQANAYLCLHSLGGLGASAQYGLSVQLVAFLSGMSAVWTSVRWPLIGQLLARHDAAGVQRALRPRMWLQYLTFTAGAAALLVLAPPMLARFGNGKQVLPSLWFALLMLNAALEMQFSLWGTLIAMGNRLTYLWPTVGTNFLGFVLCILLVRFTALGFGGLILGPLLAGILFNYWFWPLYSARNIGTNWLRFTFGVVSSP